MIRLKELRMERGISQSDMAKAFGITQPAYCHWEKGNRIPDKDSLVRLAEYFGVTVDFLLGVEPYADSHDLIFYDVIGTIKAGYNGEAIELPTGDRVPIPKQFIKGHRQSDYMVLRITGDSMYPKLLDGDYALIHKQPSVDSGSVACVLYNGNEATVKTVRYVSGEDWLELIPTNPEYPVKRLEGEADLQACRILGQVVKIIRDL